MVNMVKKATLLVTPSVVGSNGVEQVIRLHLNENDQQRFDHSFDTLKIQLKKIFKTSFKKTA